jgi:hypothetical protein
MGKPKYFTWLEEKQQRFSNAKYITIDTKEQFDEWFRLYTSPATFIYPGLYNDAQGIKDIVFDKYAR